MGVDEDTYRGIKVIDMMAEGFDFWSAPEVDRKRFADNMRKLLRPAPPKPSAFSEAMGEWLP